MTVASSRWIARTRRRTHRIADGKLTAWGSSAGRASSAAAATLGADSTLATTLSISASRPGIRDAKKSGNSAIVMWHDAQKNRATKASFGTLRTYVPCEMTGSSQTGHDDNLAVFHPAPVTYSSKVCAVLSRSCTFLGPRRLQPSRTFPFVATSVERADERGKVLGRVARFTTPKSSRSGPLQTETLRLADHERT